MNDKIIIHKERSLLEISGADRKNFLQGLITNDINKAAQNNLIFAVMLNAQGRFLYDFFIFEHEEKLFLDCLNSRRDEILKKLNFYKLRSKVEIKKNDELLSCQILGDKKITDALQFKDPRNANLGQRVYLKKTAAENFNFMDEAAYHFARISNKIPESEFDLVPEKSLILEFGFEDLNAIDYTKGCYIGQELTARTHYRGEIRKKIFHVKIAGDSSQMEHLQTGTCEINYEGKAVGTILSSVFYQNELHALALIRLPSDQEFDSFKENLELPNQKKIFIV